MRALWGAVLSSKVNALLWHPRIGRPDEQHWPSSTLCNLRILAKLYVARVLCQLASSVKLAMRKPAQAIHLNNGSEHFGEILALIWCNHERAELRGGF